MERLCRESEKAFVAIAVVEKSKNALHKHKRESIDALIAALENLNLADNGKHLTCYTGRRC